MQCWLAVLLVRTGGADTAGLRRIAWHEDQTLGAQALRVASHDLAYERAPLPVPGVCSRVVPRQESSAQPCAKLSRAAVRWAPTGTGHTHALTPQRIDLLHLHDDLLWHVLRELPHGHPFCPATSTRDYSE